MSASVLERRPSTAQPATEKRAAAFGWKPAIVLACLFGMLLAVWYSLHLIQPPWDEAGHVLNSLTVHDLLRHPRPLRLNWWHDLITVNPLYPPFVYFVSGALKLVLGQGRGVDTLVMVLFDAALSLSVFASTRKLSGSVNAGLVALSCVNLIPIVSWLSHSYLLDFPLIAMVSVATWCLIQWSSAPSWRNTLIAGTAVSACCLTKHFGFLYLILPAVICLWRTYGAERRKVALQTVVMIAMLALTAGTWVLANKGSMSTIAHSNLQQMGAQAFLQAAQANLLQYTSHLPNMLSPLMLLTLLFALPALSLKEHKALLPMAALGIGGLFAVSCITVTPALDRYAAPAMVAAASYIGVGFANIFRRAFVPSLLPAVALATLAFWQFVSFNYTPNPIKGPLALCDLSRDLGVCLLEYRGERIEKASPVSVPDWGHHWALQTIDRVDPQLEVWVHITPNSALCNVHTFQLIARELGVKARPTTSRVWSLNGDKVTFSPETALYFQWFLLTTSTHQGNVFESPESERAFNNLTNYVRTGGRFRKVGEHRLPDNTMMELYRQR